MSEDRSPASFVDKLQSHPSEDWDSDPGSDAVNWRKSNENASNKLVQSTTFPDSPRIRIRSWNLKAAKSNKKTGDVLLKNKIQINWTEEHSGVNNSEQTSNLWNPFTALQNQSFKLICNAFSDISERDYKKIANLNWTKRVSTFNLLEGRSDIKRDILNQTKKQFSSLKFRSQATKSVNEDIVDLVNTLVSRNNELPTNSKSDSLLLTRCDQLNIIDIGTQISNSQLKYDLWNIETVRSLSQERIDDIIAKLSKSIESLKNWRGIGELLKKNIEEWIQR